MCKWGTDIEMDLLKPSFLSHSGKEFIKREKIDACIAPIVKALNDAGIRTIQSCCGHGKGPGRIDLWDGRVLHIEEPA